MVCLIHKLISSVICFQAGPGIALYFQEHYQRCAAEKMNPGGVFITQSGCCSVLNSHECFSTIHNTLKHSFKHVFPYIAPVPSFGCDWGFNLAFNECAHENVASRDPSDVDAALKAAIDNEMVFLDGISYRGIMNIPKVIRGVLAKETRVMTKANPVFMF